MEYRRLSSRQAMAMTWWLREETKGYDGVICDGAIRSGKTLSVTMGFLLWSMTAFRNQSFGLCGKTVESLRRNVVLPLSDWAAGIFTLEELRSQNLLVVTDKSGRQNRYFLFGGKDESSYSLIQGITLAGVLLDEAALMPQSFVDQAAARCSVEGSRLWFNCNPAGPEHWFYKNWICQAERRNLLRLPFTLDDNPALPESIRQRYQRMYAGVFYRRYILGEWCQAEGLVYPWREEWLTEEVPERGRCYISVDYGTMNPFSAGLWKVSGGRAVRIREYYYDGRKEGRQKTDGEYHQALEELAEGLPIECVVVDPSAASFITLLRRKGIFRVRKAKNEVLSGIRITAGMLAEGRVRICPCCKDTLREFQLYCWAEDGEDRPVKEHDHAMDDIRYFCATILAREE